MFNSLWKALLVSTLISVAPIQTALSQHIVIAVGSEPSTLDPQLRDDGGERQVNDNIYEALMARDASGTLVPGLAVDHPVQIDELTWEFKLREGVAFHNGEPFNADAVVASIERVLDPELGSEQLAYLGSLAGAEKVDDLTVRITTEMPDPVLPARMYWLKMIPPDYAGQGDIAAAPVGTGPYKFLSWQRGGEIFLEANADYWGDAPAVKTVNYRFVAEPGTRLSGLMAGEFDVITNLLPEFAQSVPKFATVPGLETSMFILGVDNPVTSDVRVREALNLAIDRQALVEGLFLGYATIAQGTHVNRSAFGFHDGLEPYPYDPERARQLVEEAGATGKPLVVVGEAGRWLKDREQIEAVAAYWSETGLAVEVQILEFSAYLDRLMGPGPRPDAVFLAQSNELLDADLESSFAVHMDGEASSNSDAEMAEMIDAARSETDVAARQGMYEEIYQRAYDLHYFVPLFNLQDIYGLSERMEWTPRVDAKLIIKEMAVAE